MEFVLYKKKNGKTFSLPARADNTQTENILKKIAGLLLLSILIYVWFAYIIINPQSEFGFFLPDKGKIYYANIADMLSTGQENRWGINNIISEYYKGVAPYHYFELWLTKLFSVFTGTPCVASLYLFVYPVLNFLAMLGFLSLIERIAKVTLLKKLSVLVLLFASGFYFDSANPNFSYSMNFGESSMEYMGEKYVAYYPFIILSFLLFLEGALVPALTLLLMVPVISISTLPGVFATCVLFIAFAFFTKKLKRNEVMRLFSYLVILSGFLGVFYKCLGAADNPYFVNGIFYYTDLKGFSFFSVKVFLIELWYRIRDCPLKFLFLHAIYIPLLIVLLRQQERNYKLLLIFMIILYIISLLLYGVFYKLFDGIQFYTNDFTFLNVFIVFSLVLFIYGQNKIKFVWKTMLIVPVACLLLFKMYFAFTMHQKNISENQVYSNKYMHTIKRISEEMRDRELVGALFGGGADELDVHNDDKSGISCPYLAYIPVFYPTIDLSVFEINDWSREEEVAEVQRASAQQSPFTLFVNKQKKQNKFISIDESQVDFIKENRIKYLVISKLAKVSIQLEVLIDKQIADSKSQERFVHLNYN